MADPPPDTPEPKSALGILCVHGIGYQQQGETLLAIAAPLLDAMAGGRGYKAGDAVLRPQEALSTDPAHFSVEIDRAQKSYRVLLAESWWADVFPPPAYATLLSWLLSYGSWIMVRHMLFRWSAWIRGLRTLGRGRWDLQWLDAMWGWASMLPCMIVVAPVQIFFLLLGMLAWIPVGWLRTMAKQLMLTASALIGDANVFASNVAIHQAIQARVRRDLEWMLARTQTVVVLAHSQGAAVAYDLVRSLDDLSRIRLVTYGAGIRKLVELERQAGHPPWIVRVCPLLWAFTALTVLLGWLGFGYIHDALIHNGASAMGDRVGSLVAAYFLVLLMLFLVVSAYAADYERKLDVMLNREMKDVLAHPQFEWADLYASSDPVPGGPLLFEHAFARADDGWQTDAALPGFTGRKVTNWSSTFADHTSYWQAPNDFVPNVAGTIWRWLGVPDAAPIANPMRAWRMVYRKVCVIVLGVMVLAVYLRAHDPFSEALLGQAWTALLPQGDSPIAALLHRDVVQHGALFIAGALVYLAGVWIYARLIVDPAWSGWERAVQYWRAAGDVSSNRRLAALTRVWDRIRAWLWFVVCTTVVLLPASVCFQVASHWGYDSTWEGFLRLLEGGRAVIGALIMVVVVAGIAGLAIEAFEHFHSKR